MRKNRLPLAALAAGVKPIAWIDAWIRNASFFTNPILIGSSVKRAWNDGELSAAWQESARVWLFRPLYIGGCGGA